MNDLHYAVVVGINRYPAIGDLQGARGDACRFRDWLVEPGGGSLPEANVHLVTATKEDELTDDFLNAVPTKEYVDRALYRAHTAAGEAVRARPEEERSDAWRATRLYVFLAGHGFSPTNNSDAALLMANAARDYMGSHVAVRQYLNWYESASPFHEVVFLADCCRTRFGGVEVFAPPFTGSTEAPEDVDYFVGFATSLGDPAYEEQNPDRDRARGHFTTAVLEGLRGAKPTPEGTVTSDSLADFVGPCVRARTKEALIPQKAKFIKGTNTPMIFAEGLERSADPVTLRFPAGFRGWVQLRGGDLDESPLRLHVEAEESVEKLAAGYYRATPESWTAPDFRNGGFFEVLTGGGNGVQL
ncbi:hypothetical protein ACFVXC_15720 [Streptomyces sp. NPDC058257]|uniref:hypothetical protein n=1 Tax=Streptomyces sp. NPDC058257 TaxID=3346409 RepID=UPI0036E22307